MPSPQKQYRSRFLPYNPTIFHYNNIKSPQCAGWHRGTMPPLPEPNAEKMQKDTGPCTLKRPEKNYSYTISEQTKDTAPVPPQHRRVISRIRNDSGQLPLKSGYCTDTTLRTDAPDGQSSPKIPEQAGTLRYSNPGTTAFNSFVESAAIVAVHHNGFPCGFR